MKKYLLIASILSIIVLSMAVNLYLPYEQDQGSKAAKIVYMAKTNAVFQPLSGPNFYRDPMFSLYYMLSALVFNIIGGDIFLVMNLLSLLLGLVFFAALYFLLNKTFGISPLISFIVFISMPVLVTTFIYGNEVAFSLTFLTTSLLVFSLHFSGNQIIGAILFSLSILSRPDMALMIPFWVGWQVYLEEQDRKPIEIVKKVAITIGMLIFFLFLYWVIFIRDFSGFASIKFPFSTNIKLLAAYMSYPFNPSLVIIGFLGLIHLFIHQRKLGIVILLSALPLLFYISNLSSPKYIITLVFTFGIPSALLIDKLKPLLKTGAFVVIGIWYIFSLTPYGVFGPENGGLLFIPTADGPIPSGAYLSFYRNVQKGFFSEKYKNEIESLKLAIEFMDQNDDVVLVGGINEHFYKLNLMLGEKYAEYEEWKERRYPTSFSESLDDRNIMIQRTYLSLNKMPEAMTDQFIQSLENGQVRNITGSDDNAFPLFIEIGNTVPQGYDSDLANRILFVLDHYKGFGIVHTGQRSDLFLPTFWLKKSNLLVGIDANYTDQQWVCSLSEVENSEIWQLELPAVYSDEHDPNR